MRYTYEYKRKCVEIYREGRWPDTPEGVQDRSFHVAVRQRVRIEESQGSEALKHENSNKKWSPEEKLELVTQVISGRSCKEVALTSGISDGMLYQWVQKYKVMGYNGLVSQKKGGPCKEPQMKKKTDPRPLTESEREELIRLRAEVECMRAENEVIKKEIALREEREAARLKAKKQQSSRNSVKKDTN